ncbi:DUF1015 domain-containing protein [Thermoproteota archaeon]
MTNIKPFKGLCYNEEKVGDLSRVTCPPYDVISESEQDFYYEQSPYNYIRLVLNKNLPQDDEKDNRYSRSKVLFDEWQKVDILRQDSKPAIYFYSQDYLVNGKELSRRGFIAAMQINESGSVLPHENTHRAPKMDRLELTKKVKANLSSIFTIFSDKHKIIKSMFDDEFSKRQPDFALKDVQGVRNSIWRLTDQDKICDIAKKMEDSKAFIADGHHRCEVSSMYLKHMKEEDRGYTSQKGYNYIMTYFTAAESDGLSVLPIHRVFKAEVDVEKFGKIFKIEKCDSIDILEDKLGSASKKHCVFGLCSKGELFVLQLKDKNIVESDFIKKDCFKDLDVAIVDNYVLAELLGIEKSAITYLKEASQAKDMVDQDQGNVAFFMRPTTVEQIKDVALCGEKMPPKSTYFYPKLLSGLVAYPFE